MRNFAALGLLGAAALAAASDVVDLKQDTFKGFVEENDLVLAECKHRFLLRDTVSTCLTTANSLRPLVRTLQGTCSRVRGGCYNPQGEEHCSGQDRLHRGSRPVPRPRCRGLPYPQGLQRPRQCLSLQRPAQGPCVRDTNLSATR